LWIAGGGTTIIKILTSTDGKSWTTSESGNTLLNNSGYSCSAVACRRVLPYIGINIIQSNPTVIQDITSVVNAVFYNTTTNQLVYNNTTGSSDIRLKNNIVQADQMLCYSTIQSMNLHYFEWSDEYFKHTGMHDKHALGFIAQEVKQYFPNAVQINSNQFFPDFHSLNPDQIYKSHIGATKQLMAIVQAQQSTIDSLVTIINSRTT
jgi:hypothetical protein